MSQVLSASLASNFASACKLVGETIRQFTAEQWTSGIDQFQVPWKIAYHIIECLDFYFFEQAVEGFEWGRRFQGAWWELPADRIPSQADLLLYLAELEARIAEHFKHLDDTQCAASYEFDRTQLPAPTRLAHYVYAIRHTMHHHGALSLLSLSQGNPPGNWE